MKLKNYLLPALLLVGATAAQASVIDTTAAWDGDHGAFPFGRPNTATIGQTFNTGENNYLEQLSFHLRDDLIGQTVEFQVYLAAWDGDSALDGTAQLLGQFITDGSGNYQMFDLTALALSLNTFSDYLFFLTTSYSFVGHGDSEAWVGSVVSDGYAAGDLVFLNNGDQFGDIYNENWSYWYDSDLAFGMTLSSIQDVSAPATLGLFGLGMIALMARRKRSA